MRSRLTLLRDLRSLFQKRNFRFSTHDSGLSRKHFVLATHDSGLGMKCFGPTPHHFGTCIETFRSGNP